MRKLFGVGINKFLDPGAALSGCVQDCATVRAICVDPVMGFNPLNIRLACDERATRVNLFERLAWMGEGWNNPDPRYDAAVIQLSCHGTQLADRNGDEVGDKLDECMCPYDFPNLWDRDTAPDVEDCKAYLGYAPGPLLCDDDFGEFLSRIPKHVSTTVILDACHSGSGTRDVRAGIKNRGIRAPFDIMSRAMGRLLPLRKFGAKPVGPRDAGDIHYVDQNHVLLSGCRDDQTSADAFINGQSQGAMTWSLNEALAQLGFFTGIRPTWLTVHSKMLELLAAGGFDQRPQLTGPEDLLRGPVFGLQA
jgi:metacaspase-1